MILIGTMNWPSTRGSGQFFCPVCNATTAYKHKVSRPFLTLYFVPVLPIGGLQEYVQCGTCRQAFEPAVLSMSGTDTSNPSQSPVVQADDAPFKTELLRLMVLIMSEDGTYSPSELRIAKKVYDGITRSDLPREELLSLCDQARVLPLNTTSYLEAVATKFDYDEKLLLVQAVFAVAGADGAISPQRMQALLKMREILNLDASAFQQAISDAAQWV